MPSGAFHDASILATVMPAAMIFIPSVGGVSHDFSEDTALDDIVLGAQVFTDATARFDRRLGDRAIVVGADGDIAAAARTARHIDPRLLARRGACLGALQAADEAIGGENGTDNRHQGQNF